MISYIFIIFISAFGLIQNIFADSTDITPFSAITPLKRECFGEVKTQPNVIIPIPYGQPLCGDSKKNLTFSCPIYVVQNPSRKDKCGLLSGGSTYGEFQTINDPSTLRAQVNNIQSTYASTPCIIVISTLMGFSSKKNNNCTAYCMLSYANGNAPQDNCHWVDNKGNIIS